MSIAFVKGLGSAALKPAGTSLAVPCSGTVAAGNSIFVMLGIAFVTDNPTVTDNLGNTYTFERRTDNGTAFSAMLYRAIVSNPGALTSVTISHASVGKRAAIVAEFSGVGNRLAVGGFPFATTTSCWATPGTNDTSPVSGVLNSLWIGAHVYESPPTETIGIHPESDIGAAEPMEEVGTTGSGATTNITTGSLFWVVSTTAARTLRTLKSSSGRTSAGAGASYAPAPTTPSVPQGQFTARDHNHIDWNGDQPGAIGYDLERERWNGSAWVDNTLHTDLDGTIKHETELQPYTTYRWRVRSNLAGNTSDWSGWVQFTTEAPLAQGQFTVHDRDTVAWTGQRQSSGGFDAYAHDRVAVSGTRTSTGTFQVYDHVSSSWIGYSPTIGTSEGQFTLLDAAYVNVAGERDSVGAFAGEGRETSAWTGYISATTAFDVHSHNNVMWSGTAPEVGTADGQFFVYVLDGVAVAGQVVTSAEFDVADLTTAVWQSNVVVSTSFDVQDLNTVEWDGTAPVVPLAEGSFTATATESLEWSAEVDTSTEFTVHDRVELLWYGHSPHIDAVEGQFFIHDTTTVEFIAERESVGEFALQDTVEVDWSAYVVTSSGFHLYAIDSVSAAGQRNSAGTFDIYAHDRLSVDGSTDHSGLFYAYDISHVDWSSSEPRDITVSVLPGRLLYEVSEGAAAGLSISAVGSVEVRLEPIERPLAIGQSSYRLVVEEGVLRVHSLVYTESRLNISPSVIDR